MISCPIGRFWSQFWVGRPCNGLGLHLFVSYFHFFRTPFEAIRAKSGPPDFPDRRMPLHRNPAADEAAVWEQYIETQNISDSDAP
jgi:hypothetical protein